MATLSSNSTVEALASALKTPEGWWTLASNTIPVVGVLVFGWAALPLLIFYWIENVLIGAFNVPKIVIAGVSKGAPLSWLSLLLAPFFVFHYGLFCFVHGIFIFAVFAMTGLISSGVEPTTDSFDVTSRVAAMLQSDSDLRWSVIALLAVLTFRFLVLWLGRREWRVTDPMRQMFEPYGRIVVLHLTIMVMTIPILLIGQPVIAVLFLALFKTALELGLPYFRIGRAAGELQA
jgi:hypothetical protein